MSDFANKRVWFVTGSSTGFGRHLVDAVLASGERVVATLRKPGALDDLARKHSKQQLLILPLDVTNNEQIDAAFEAVKETFGRLDVVVNSAGFGQVGEVEVIDEPSARKLLDVLFWGAVNVTKRAVPFFREVNPKGQGGRILQISSEGGFVTFPLYAYYHAGKFALEGFTESMQKELPSEWNIKMTIIEPGEFKTEFGKASLTSYRIHPAYVDSPKSKELRDYLMLPNFGRGDPKKAVQAMIKVSNLENPPMRVPLGPDALQLVTDKCKEVLAEVDKFKEIGLSCTWTEENK